MHSGCLGTAAHNVCPQALTPQPPPHFPSATSLSASEPVDRLIINCSLHQVFIFVVVVLADNGLNPVWWVTFDVDVINPPLAYLRFVVNDEDMFGEPNFIGHAIFPMCSLKTGK